MAKVTAYVYVLKDGYPVRLAPGDTVPEGAEVTNPAVLADEPAPEKEPEKAPARKPAASKE